MKAQGGSSLHPIIALFSDGEEYGLLGAASALDNPAFRARVGAVVNVEARGNRGPSLLFQTSPGDGPLVDLYARSVTHYATSSLFATIYKYLPNDTDLTLFIRGGFVSYNFAFSDNVAHYHTPRDTRANLSPVILQHHGENLLGMAVSLEHVDFAGLKGGKDDIYLTVMGKWLPRMAASWALPLSILALVLIALSGWIGGAPPRWRGIAAGIGAPLALLVGSAVIGWVLHGMAVLVSGQPDPSFAYPLALRISLALGVAGVTLLCARPLSPRGAALAGWLWYAALAIVSAIFATGLSPYFLFPALVAIVLLFVAARFGWDSLIGQGALFLAAIPALFVWMGLVATGETLMGLALHPLFTIPAAFAAFALLPLIGAREMPRPVWLGVAGVLLACAIGAAVTAGLQPAYSAMAPQRLNVAYVEDHATGKAVFAADAAAPLPAAMRATAAFSQTPDSPYAFARVPAYIADAGAPRLAAPTADVSQSALPNGRRVTLALHGSGQTAQMALVVPESVPVTAITVDGTRTIVGPEWKKGIIVLCTTGDCAHGTISLETSGTAGFDLTLGERRFGVPDFGARIVAARPDSAVQSQLGDSTVILSKVTVPKG